ncbi:MAG: thioredoxin domain-containing protein [Sandaracinaceae bacterium]|nr:thioredoxin domain-containing protein [Sandaracinaceae bacterium]
MTSAPARRSGSRALLLLVGAMAAMAPAGPSADARRLPPRETPASVYAESTTRRVRVDASSAAAQGPVDAPLTMVLFAEFQDPFTARVQPTLQLLRDAYGADLRIVFRHRPLDFHAHSRNAARAAQEALEQGGATWFWAMHDKLLASQSALDVESLVTYARELGLDEQRFRRALGDGRHDAVIAVDEADAEYLGARASPNFFVNGVQITGAQPLEAFRAVMDAELALATRAMALGASRQDIYGLAMATPRAAPGAPSAANGAVAATPADAPVFRVPLDPNQPVRGAADALVTVVVFSDFQCPFCARVVPTLASLEQRYGRDLRLVFRHNPLPFHQDAMPAAQAAVEAFVQRGSPGFWAMHDLLFANPRSLSRADLERYAQQVGLDMRRFSAALDQQTHRARVEADMDAARALGASGTPTFFINGRQLTGAQPEARFVEAVDRALAEAQALVSSGTPRRQVYARSIRNGLTTPPPQPPSAGTGTAAAGRPTLDPEAVYHVPVTRAQPSRGPANALVTLVLFTDFECPFCSRVAPTLDAILQQYGSDVRLVFRNNPLSFHNHAQLAAEAALEASAQGGDSAFWRYHDLLFANQRALERADLESYARQIGLDMPRFAQALDGHVHAAAIDADRALAAQLGATGTPSVFVNGKLLRGAQPLQAFQARVDTELAAARQLVRRGTPRARVYEQIIRGGATAPVMLPPP